MNLREALVLQAPSLALQREAQAEIARLDAEVKRLRDCLSDARDDVLTELQRLREAAGRPQIDRRLAAQQALADQIDRLL